MVLRLGLVLGLGVAVVKHISHQRCMSRDPVLQKMWDAARRGDAPVVRQMLRNHRIPPNTVHHVYKNHLVLDIAAMWTPREQHDGKLRDVLRVLAGAGWQMDVRDEKSGENAAHLLAGQIGGAVEERLKFLVHTVKQTPMQQVNLLTAADARGRVPQERVQPWLRCNHRVRQLCRVRAIYNRGPVAVVTTGGSASGTTATEGSATVVTNSNAGAAVNGPGPVSAATVVSSGRQAGSSEAAQVIHPEIGCVVS